MLPSARQATEHGKGETMATQTNNHWAGLDLLWQEYAAGVFALLSAHSFTLEARIGRIQQRTQEYRQRRASEMDAKGTNRLRTVRSLSGYPTLCDSCHRYKGIPLNIGDSGDYADASNEY
jgi:hypothetical protein